MAGLAAVAVGLPGVAPAQGQEPGVALVLLAAEEEDLLRAPGAVVGGERRPGGSLRGERANFTRLVLGGIEAKFCNKICVGKLSPRSTQCTPLHRFGIVL